VLAGIQHSPAIDPNLAVGERNRRQFQAQTLKPGHKRFNIKFWHFNTTQPSTILPPHRIIELYRR
jgi:hypothetical protein